jgi:hypothetical protein
LSTMFFTHNSNILNEARDVEFATLK